MTFGPLWVVRYGMQQARGPLVALEDSAQLGRAGLLLTGGEVSGGDDRPHGAERDAFATAVAEVTANDELVGRLFDRVLGTHVLTDAATRAVVRDHVASGGHLLGRRPAGATFGQRHRYFSPRPYPENSVWTCCAPSKNSWKVPMKREKTSSLSWSAEVTFMGTPGITR